MTAAKEGKTKKALIHFVAHCADCPWETGDYLTGQRSAKNHADRYRHKVTAESGYSLEYNGRRPQ